MWCQKNIQNKGKIKWSFREEPINNEDNGWKFLSDIDTDDFINDPNNMTIYKFSVIQFEPAILNKFNIPTLKFQTFQKSNFLSALLEGGIDLVSAAIYCLFGIITVVKVIAIGIGSALYSIITTLASTEFEQHLRRF